MGIMMPIQVGDGTTTVVILAGEFLRESKPFVEEGVHPQSLIRSFRQAGELAVQKVKDISISIEGKSAEEKKDMLKKCAMTSLNSKLVGATSSSTIKTCTITDAIWHQELDHRA